MVSEQTNRTLFMLTVVTVAALPMTIIPGLFGMNLPSLPLQHNGGGFWILILLVSVLSSSARVREELAHFAVAAAALEGKDVRIVGWGDASEALELVEESAARARRKTRAGRGRQRAPRR